ncbi:hypothetical protein PMAA_002250 [Talaromyces marneffei ATCC 18224]|uniref:Aminoglycoside phosphotransferase domain-containing protein n=1 Tax=Talaromyces marneffei (strain ATCC 18224 / CBS 334.59 / QM 7333) TaxID=441960 RepID=B6QSN6_TALMQ|nr:hypothetical protein PMAA_002250 [Talaromyces marneffei ATCC 18224]
MSVQLDNQQSIIDYCRSCPDDQLIGGSKYGNRVVKLPNYDLVVKFGRQVSSYEAKNQQKEYNIVDPKIVTVPWVHNFFVDDEGWGYMVSDFIAGKTIDPLPHSHIQKLASVLDVEQVEEWFNSRLFPRDDITPRNLIWLDGGRICLLDWESAGFYPRQLEFASLFYQEYHFGDVLLSAIGFGSERDKEEQQKICQALYNNERYTFRPPDILEGSKASSIFPLPQIPEPQKFSF